MLGQALAFTTGTFALVNAGVTLVWLVVAHRIAARHARLTGVSATRPVTARASGLAVAAA